MGLFQKLLGAADPWPAAASRSAPPQGLRPGPHAARGTRQDSARERAVRGHEQAHGRPRYEDRPGSSGGAGAGWDREAVWFAGRPSL